MFFSLFDANSEVCPEFSCLYCFRKESLPETWLRCFSLRTQSFSWPQHKSSENYFPKVFIVYLKWLHITMELVKRAQRDWTKIVTSSFMPAPLRAQPTDWWSHKHAWSSGKVCGVLEEERQLHTTGQFVKTVTYTVQNAFHEGNDYMRCSFRFLQVTNGSKIC